MTINHNISAMNASRQLGLVNNSISKSTEKLSSGYRINRSADDAAGLSISEKMRKQIRGLTQGIANAEDGISLCQVADGALNEVTDMIQRISELAVKSANGTNSSSDREDIQILQGHLNDLTGTQFYVNCCTDCCPKTVYFTDDTSIQYKTSVDYLDGEDRISELKIGLKKANGTYYSNAEEFCKYIVDTMKPILNTNVPYEHVEFAYNGSTLYLFDTDNDNWSPANKESAYFCDSEDFTDVTNDIAPQRQIFIQSGADAGDGIMLTISAVNTQTLELDEIDVLSEHNSLQTIKATNNALKHVSANRSRIGAQQNRLEHTIKNEDNIVENTTAAESQIRDTDMATESVRYAMQSILMQAGQSMLAQANQINQGILTLLQ